MNIQTPSSPSNSALAGLTSQDINAFGKEHEQENQILSQEDQATAPPEQGTGTTTPELQEQPAAAPTVPPAPSRVCQHQEIDTLLATQRPRITRPDTVVTEIAFQFTINLNQAPVNHA